MTHTSIIIRTKNSADILAQTLKGLFSQTFTDFDVMIVDSGSKDDTVSIAQKFVSNIVSIKAEDYFPGKVLNSAIERTKSDLIVFLNSDAVFLTPGSLELLLNSFDDPNVQAAFGRQIPRPDAKTWVLRDYGVSFPSTVPAPPWLLLSFPIAAMRRSIWEKRPLYTDAWGSEDTEWGYWAQKNDVLIKYVPEALVMHSHNYTLRELYGRRFIEGEADVFIYGRRYNWVNIIIDLTKSSVNDLIYYFKARDLLRIPFIPIRRFVYYWSYYKGYQVGIARECKTRK